MDASTGAQAKRLPLRFHVPNALTAARLVVIPVFVLLLARAPGGHSWPAAMLFAAASLTDWFDGWLARRLAHSTRFGRLVDPLADRLLIDAAVVLLWWHGRLPLIAPLLILARDLALLGGLRLVASRGYELSVILLGKAATTVLMLSLGFIMVTRAGVRWPVYLFDVGLGLALVAGLVYIVTVRGRLQAEAQGRSAA